MDVYMVTFMISTEGLHSIFIHACSFFLLCVSLNFPDDSQHVIPTGLSQDYTYWSMLQKITEAVWDYSVFILDLKCHEVRN